jgi:hypothetical protein
MGMNPDTNRFEELITGEEKEALEKLKGEFDKLGAIESMESAHLLRPNGEPVPKHWSVFKVGEDIVIKNYTFRVAYIGETSILFEPVGPVVVNHDDPKTL